jgi:hypothetical protein
MTGGWRSPLSAAGWCRVTVRSALDEVCSRSPLSAAGVLRPTALTGALRLGFVAKISRNPPVNAGAAPLVSHPGPMPCPWRQVAQLGWILAAEATNLRQLTRRGRARGPLRHGTVADGESSPHSSKAALTSSTHTPKRPRSTLAFRPRSGATSLVSERQQRPARTASAGRTRPSCSGRQLACRLHPTGGPRRRCLPGPLLPRSSWPRRRRTA